MGGAVMGRIVFARRIILIRFLPGAFGFGTHLGFFCLEFAVALADLLFNFFDDGIYCGVEVALDVFGEEVWAAHAEADGAAELFFRHAGVVVLKGDAGIHDALIHMVQLVELGDNVVFDGFGEGHVVRGQNQFHKKRMRLERGKIQFFL